MIDPDRTLEQLIELVGQGYSYREAGAKVGLSRLAAAGRLRRANQTQSRIYQNKPKPVHPVTTWLSQREVPIPEIRGIRAKAPPDEEEVYRRALTEYGKTHQLEQARASQIIQFDKGPVCLVFAADLHLGDAGTDYERVFQEGEIIASTPGMYLVVLGDLVNQFVLGTLRQARDEARLTISDEWALVRKYLRLTASKLVATVAGNHDNWTVLLTGIDYFREVVGSLNSKTLYDSDDARFKLVVAGAEFPGRIRHTWRGNSMYNPTHGIELAYRMDGDFLWGVGGHFHTSGVARSFNASGRNGMAVLCGSYKRIDQYARQKGFPHPNSSASVAILFDPDSASMVGFDNLRLAAKVMQLLYPQNPKGKRSVRKKH